MTNVAYKSLTPVDPTWRIAVHEAAHAVVALVVGSRIGALTIEPGTLSGEGYAGLAASGLSFAEILDFLKEAPEQDDETDEEERKDRHLGIAVREVQVAYAGKAAEELFFGGGNPETWAWDLSGAGHCIERGCDDVEDGELLLAWLTSRVAKVVAAKHEVIEGVARRLLEAKTMTADEVTAAIGEATSVAIQKRKTARLGEERP